MSWTQTVLQVAEPQGYDEPETPALACRKVQIASATVWAELRAAKEEAATDSVMLTLVQPPELHDYLSEEEAPIPGEYLLRVAKTSISDQLRFLDTSQARASAEGNPGEFESCSVLRLADIASPLEAGLGIAVVPWDYPATQTAPLGLGQPTRAVRDYAKTPVVPINVATWLAPQSDPISGLHPFFGPLASQRLALCLPNSIEGDPLHLFARLEGKIKAKSAVEPATDAVWTDISLYSALNDACVWVYSEPREISNKHALLTGEIARAWSDDSWGAGLALLLEDALISAQVAYRLHLQEKGVDALKLMADLRKGVAEDVRGVSAQISALSAALWRDTAVALGTVALKNTGAVSNWVTALVALYLAVGGYLTLRWADQAVSAIRDNELAFRRALYRPLLTENSYKELALNRYNKVLDEYSSFRCIIILVYIAAIFGVIAALIVPLFYADNGCSKTIVMKFLSWVANYHHLEATCRELP